MVTAARWKGPEMGGGPFTGTGVLVRFMLRRDRIKLPVWVGALGALVVYIAAALPQLAPKQADLASVTVMFNQPVGRMFTGPAYGLAAPSYESVFVAGYGLYFAIIAALMNIMLVVRHTRLEEQTGRAELVRANVTGRYSALTAALLVAVIANAGAIIVIASLMSAHGYAAAGSWLFACGIGSVGLAFAGISAITVQLSEFSRGAAGIAGAALGAAFVVRMGGDMLAIGGTALSWVSPLAWAQQSAPFVHDRWWTLILPLALFLAATAVGYALQSRRDLGASLIAVRSGRSSAHPALGTPLGLAFRLQRGSILGWGIALLLAGVVDGAFAQSLVDAAADVPEAFQEMFGGTHGMLNGYLAFIAVFIGYLTAAYAVTALQVLGREESHGRTDALLATPMSRRAWLASHIAVVAVASLAIMVLAGFGAGVAASAATGHWSLVWDVTAAHLNITPAPLLVVGLAGLLYGVAPRLMAPVCWALVALMMIVGNFSTLLDLPEFVMNLSPLNHPAQMPAEPFALAPVVVLLAIATGAAMTGVIGFRRRQVNT